MDRKTARTYALVASVGTVIVWLMAFIGGSSTASTTLYYVGAVFGTIAAALSWARYAALRK